MGLFICGGKITGFFIVHDLWWKLHNYFMYFKICMLYDQMSMYTLQCFLENCEVTPKSDVLGPSYNSWKIKMVDSYWEFVAK